MIGTGVGTGVNYATSTAFNETGKCAVSNGYSLLFNSGWSEITNSNPIDALNDNRTVMLSAGIEYAKGPSTVTVLANNSETIYSRSAAVTVVGLANLTDFHTFTLSYTRQINANLSVNGSDRIGRDDERIHLRSPEGASADLYSGDDVVVDAEAGSERIRVQNDFACDNGGRQR